MQFFLIDYDNYDNYNEYDNYNSGHEEYDPDMVKKEEPDEETANGSRYSSSYYTKPEHGEDFNENGQTDNYDEWDKRVNNIWYWLYTFFLFCTLGYKYYILLVYIMTIYIYKHFKKKVIE